MPDTTRHDESIVRAFIAPHRREQFLRRLANPKTRHKILGQLAHFHDLDPRYAHRIPPRDQTTDGVYRLLKGKGAPDTCYAMGHSDLDGQVVPLREALEDIVPVSFGQFVSCIPGKLGYFGGEESNEHYILER